MEYWMIAAIALALIAAGLGVTCALQHKEILRAREGEERARKDAEELLFLRTENVRQRREAAAIQRALEAEQANCDRLEDDLYALEDELEQAKQRIQRAEARRTEAEKDVYASRMRVGQLEKQLADAHSEQLNQERIYQDILSERDEMIAKLQGAQPKRRSRKKTDVLDQQVTISDILGEL